MHVRLRTTVHRARKMAMAADAELAAHLGEVQDVAQDGQQRVAALQDGVGQLPLLGSQPADQQQL